MHSLKRKIIRTNFNNKKKKFNSHKKKKFNSHKKKKFNYQNKKLSCLKKKKIMRGGVKQSNINNDVETFLNEFFKPLQ